MVTYARLMLPINLLKKSSLAHDREKLCSKFGEDRSINHVTILSTDAGYRRLDTGHVILCSVGC